MSEKKLNAYEEYELELKEISERQADRENAARRDLAAELIGITLPPKANVIDVKPDYGQFSLCLNAQPPKAKSVRITIEFPLDKETNA